MTRAIASLAALAAAAAALAALAGASAAEEKAPDVKTIVEHANRVAYYQGRDGRAQVTMTITDKEGRTRTRQFTILRRDEQPADEKDDATCGDQQFYVHFDRPADLNKMVFMVHKHLDRDDDRWLYMPALDLVKRIAAGDKRTSFVGSNFFYEDVSGRRTTDDRHELVETTDTYYVLKSTPEKPDTVEFAHYRAYIHRQTFLPVRIEYFDAKGEKYRMYEAKKVDTIGGRPTVTKSVMKDLASGGETLLEYSDVKYDVGLPAEVFEERYLRQPPRKYLR